jgi:uracil-DNA glycosylase
MPAGALPVTRVLSTLLSEIRACRECAAHLPLGPRPILAASPSARLLLIGQAPGLKVHQSGVAWDDRSGDRLREWLGIDRTTFYDERRVALVPTGFCYPGSGKQGDLPPRPECAPKWHGRLLPLLSSRRLTLLIGAHAQGHFLGPRSRTTLTETVRAWVDYLPQYFVLPHPSPRNGIWLRRNPWFELDCLPDLRTRVRAALIFER